MDRRRQKHKRVIGTGFQGIAGVKMGGKGQKIRLMSFMDDLKDSYLVHDTLTYRRLVISLL